MECVQLFFLPKAAHMINEVPDLLGSDPRFAVEARHGRAQAVADIHENLSIRGSMIPFIIGQVRSLGFSCRGELFRFLAITTAGRAVAVHAQAIVKPLARRQGFRSRGHGIFNCLWIRLHRGPVRWTGMARGTGRKPRHQCETYNNFK